MGSSDGAYLGISLNMVCAKAPGRHRKIGVDVGIVFMEVLGGDFGELGKEELHLNAGWALSLRS